MKLTASEKNMIASMRLKYVMQLKGKRPVDLINYVLENTDIYVSAPMMSQYLDGKKHIPQDTAVAFAECLDIEAGYILGLDGYVEHNNDYLAYCSTQKTMKSILALEKSAKDYDKYLSHEGYSVKSFHRIHGKVSEMIVISDKNSKEYPLTTKELDNYVKDIKKYYKERTKQLLKNTLKEGDAE